MSKSQNVIVQTLFCSKQTVILSGVSAKDSGLGLSRRNSTTSSVCSYTSHGSLHSDMHTSPPTPVASTSGHVSTSQQQQQQQQQRQCQLLERPASTGQLILKSAGSPYYEFDTDGISLDSPQQPIKPQQHTISLTSPRKNVRSTHNRKVSESGSISSMTAQLEQTKLTSQNSIQSDHGNGVIGPDMTSQDGTGRSVRSVHSSPVADKRRLLSRRASDPVMCKNLPKFTKSKSAQRISKLNAASNSQNTSVSGICNTRR